MSIKQFDTIIIGGGIVGASTADVLTQHGQKVLLIDQFEPGHTQGSSHGDGRIIRLGYAESVYVEMAIWSYRAWHALSEAMGKPLIQRTGTWECGPIGGQWIRELEASFRHFDIPHQRYSATESNQRFPQYHIDDDSEAMYHPAGGVVFATKAVQAFWAQVRLIGGTTRSGERVERIEANESQSVVHLVSGERLSAKKLVITAGGWANKLLTPLGLTLPLNVTQEQVAYFVPKNNINAPDHTMNAMPTGDDHHQDDIFFILPQIDIPGVKIGWHQTGSTIDPDDERRPIDDHVLTATQQLVQQRFPFLDPTPTFQQVCLYTNTSDDNFILDRHPTLPNIIIGAGFSGHGFKFGPVLGEILAALVMDEEPPVDLDIFRVDRFKDRQKSPQHDSTQHCPPSSSQENTTR
ncbi:MAG: N-methyl-L-tryptophan oxidase [Chloroflexota bacterium]